jgi:hypothetical protein
MPQCWTPVPAVRGAIIARDGREVLHVLVKEQVAQRLKAQSEMD